MKADEEIARAMWAGDLDRLDELARCECCCDVHTHEDCPARAWEGCRGQGTLTRREIAAWAAHYGMSVNEFEGFEETSEEKPPWRQI